MILQEGLVDGKKTWFVISNKTYVKNPSEAPSGVAVKKGKRGGYYYDENPKQSMKVDDSNKTKVKQLDLKLSNDFNNFMNVLKPRPANDPVSKSSKEGEEWSEKLKQVRKNIKFSSDRVEHLDRWLFGLDWVGRDSMSVVLCLNKVAGDLFDRDFIKEILSYNDILDKSRPIIAGKGMGMIMLHAGFIGISQDGKQIDRYPEYKEVLMKEKEFSDSIFDDVLGKEIYVYRGVSKDFVDKLEANENGEIVLKEMPLSSYTLDEGVAKEFSKNGGMVFRRKVTKNDVWFGIHSNPNFAGGYENEKEIVIGNREMDTVFPKENYYANEEK